MKKIAVVYWSGTGNTKAMAEEIVEGIKEENHDADLIFCSEFTKDDIGNFDGFAFGCPAMGAEELEDGEFEPMFEDVEDSLSNKPVLLFGSYEWADGEWMETWQERCEEKNINLVCDGLIAYDYPDDDALNECKKASKKLVEAE